MVRRYALIALFVALFATVIAQAQPPVETVEPDATAQATAPVVTDTEETGNDETAGSPGETNPSNGMNPDMVFIGIVLLALVFGMADKFTNYRLSKELAAAVPGDWKPVLEHGANTARRIVYERAGAFADSTESPIDNNLLDEEMKQAGWEFYIDPATGERHARKRIVASTSAPQGGTVTVSELTAG